MPPSPAKPSPFPRLRRFTGAHGQPLLLGVLLLFLVLTYVVVLNALRPHTPGRELSLNQLASRVSSGQIKQVTLLAQDRRLVGRDSIGPWWTGTGGNDFLISALVQRYQETGGTVRVDTQPAKDLLNKGANFVLPSATLLVGFLFLYTLIRGTGNKETSKLGRSQDKRYEDGATRVTFADVAGNAEAVQELQEVKDFLTSPDTYAKLGAKPPRGILLIGPPGCGKTLLAKAVAGEAGVPFFSVSGSQFAESLVGIGPARVRDLFKKAREAGPSIIFVDEIDAVGRARSGVEGFNAETESTLNELLVQLDGFDTGHRIVLMAATNRPDILDEALVRKGRFDRQIVLDTPDFAGRLAIAKVHARGKPLAADVDLERFARRTVGLSGADIAAALNDAATLAVRRRLPKTGMRELLEAVERVVAGPEKQGRILSDADRQRIAVHESGHAVVQWATGSMVTVEKVSIVSRGHSLGTTWSLPVEDQRVRTLAQYEEELAAIMAGRAAEEVVFGDPSSGSQIDLSRATALARHLVVELGMSPDLGPVSLAAGGHSQETAAAADREVRRLLEEADARAFAVISKRRAALDRLTERLLGQETVDRDELEDLLSTPTSGPRTRRRAAPVAS
ncbi:MAG: AAA family ATPase [Actinobacteria bacterium]|nr:AAA family ATPase [Actinomycetota bacterium]